MNEFGQPVNRSSAARVNNGSHTRDPRIFSARYVNRAQDEKCVKYRSLFFQVSPLGMKYRIRGKCTCVVRARVGTQSARNYIVDYVTAKLNYIRFTTPWATLLT